MKNTTTPMHVKWSHIINKLAGGPPNQEKQSDKRWYVRYDGTLFFLFLSFAVFLAPDAISRLNGIPEPTALQTLEVRILQTYTVEPHMLVQLSNGSQRSMEWPVPISGGHGGFRSYVWSDEDRQKLRGCLVTVRGTPLRWTIDKRFRVWELNCPEKAIRVSFSRSTHHFKRLMAARDIVLMLGLPAWFFLGFVIYLRERRGYL